MKPGNHRPPKLAQKVLFSFLREDISEEVQGDLEEKFYNNVNRRSSFWAKISYWYQVINYLRPFAIKKFNSQRLTHLTMFQHDIKISWRNLKKQKTYSFIKIGGLAVGIAASFLIFLFIKHSLSYDRHFPDNDLVYRVIGMYDETGSSKSPYYPAALASSLKRDFPEIEHTGHFIGNELIGLGSKMVRRTDEEKNIYEESFIYTDQGLLDILKPQIINGNPSEILTEPFSIAISNSKAQKYFPNENPIGKTIILNNDEKQPYVVKGVFEDFPDASFFQYEFLLTLVGTETWTGDNDSWKNNIHQTFIKVLPGTNSTLLASKITENIATSYMLPSMRDAGMINAEEIINNFKFKLQPVKDIYLRSAGIRDDLKHGDIRYIWVFSAVAVFIILIACINFINLSIARSANRSTEIGLRKVMGSYRKELVNQFLIESVLFSALSFLLALFLSIIFLPYYNILTKLNLLIPWKEWWFFPSFIAGFVIVGVFAGLYPAVYLSGFKPLRMLKKETSHGYKSSGIRGMLVVFQFTTSFILIIGTLIIFRQLNFIMNNEAGFNKEQVLQINGTDIMNRQLPVFKKELLKMPNVVSVSVSDYLPIAGARRSGNMFWKEGRKEADSPIEGQIWSVDNDYIRTMGMDIVYGRDFELNMASDSQFVIINQTMAKALELDNPIGQQIETTWTKLRVIGVVKDFHYESMNRKIGPLCLVIGNSPSVVSVRYNVSNVHGVIKSLNGIWDHFCPNEPIRYSFLNEDFAEMYSDVKRTGNIIMSFAILTMIIACLGLFALISFVAEQRRKEISIRLVMGASIKNIYRLMIQDFLVLILISFFISIPTVWYLMTRWIQTYAYRAQIGWDVFLLAGIIGLIIALATISYQAIKAAVGNPVENLR